MRSGDAKGHIFGLGHAIRRARQPEAWVASPLGAQVLATSAPIIHLFAALGSTASTLDPKPWTFKHPAVNPKLEALKIRGRPEEEESGQRALPGLSL